MRLVALTTVDNPFDPFDEFDAWYAFDLEKGYNSCCYLDKIAKTSNELSDSLNRQEIERAIDEICEENILGIYKKVVKEVPD